MKQRKETPLQREVFEIYYALGEGRTLEKLHRYLDSSDSWKTKVPSIQTLKNWSSWFAWQERVQQRDLELNKQISKKAKQDIVDMKAKYRAIIRAILSEVVKSLNALKDEATSINIRTTNDLERIALIFERCVRLDMELLGEMEHGTQIKVVLAPEYLSESMKAKLTDGSEDD